MSGHDVYKVRELASHRHNHVRGQRVGIEIECEGARIDWDILADEADACGFRLESDHSLRNDGIEFVSQGPTLVNNALYDSLLSVYDLIDCHGLESNARTGIHVHLDMQNNTLEQVQRIVTLYCLVEPWLYRVCGPEREENIYCVPWYRSWTDAESFAKAMEHYYNGDSSGYVRQRISEACKYAGLFIQPLRTFGTLEFRMAPTFKTGEELVSWVRLVVAIGDVAKSFASPEEILEAWDTDAHALLERVGFTSDIIGPIDIIAQITDCYGVAEIVARQEAEVLDWKQAYVPEPPQERRPIIPDERVAEMLRSWQGNVTRVTPTQEAIQDSIEESI